MGLDQWAIAHKTVNILGHPTQVVREIASWRKHNRLQGWAESVYSRQGGTEEFNFVPIDLTLDDIITLEETIKCGNLPETEGFFFGQDSYSDMNHYFEFVYEKDKQFCQSAKQLMREGWQIFYNSWW
tara:strand:- start:545 stop:925 length:381 start_codon:yes stop_codon:yes gene_type:complete